MSSRNIFAVCDLEVEYAYHFMEYLSKKNNIPFEIRVFTSSQTFLDFVKDHPVEVLLIGEGAMCEEIREHQIGQIMILSEGVLPEKLKEYPSIYKYQSSHQIIREVMASYGERKSDEGGGIRVGKKNVEVIGIYSPVGRTMKTTFALTLGQMLAKTRAVLYLNMEVYSGFEYLLNKTYPDTLSDVLYYLRQENGNIMGKISGMIQTMNNLDYLPPALSPGDLLQTRPEEWDHLLADISSYSSYEIVILDLGDGVQELSRILEQCTKIYMPVRNDPMSKAKVDQFENLIKLWNKEFILERINKIHLPYHRTIRGGAGYLDDLVWSELGDYVRELIRTGGKEEEVSWNGESCMEECEMP